MDGKKVIDWSWRKNLKQLTRFLVFMAIWIFTVRIRHVEDPAMVMLYSGLTTGLLVMFSLMVYWGHCTPNYVGPSKGWAHAMLFIAWLASSSAETNLSMRGYEVRKAKEYPQLVADPLENYRKAHARYPEKLEQLWIKEEAPRTPDLLKGGKGDVGYHLKPDGGYEYVFVTKETVQARWTWDNVQAVWLPEYEKLVRPESDLNVLNVFFPLLSGRALEGE